MKENLLNIVDDYLSIFPEEKGRQTKLINYLHNNTDEQIIDWNNFTGHVVASGFIYAKKENKFLVLYHNDLQMFLYPGGHFNKEDKTPLQAALREIKEETGLDNLKSLNISENELIPLDIDTHIISYNKRLDLPKHYHFDFRYLFIIDKISNITVDTNELSKYKWIDMKKLANDQNYGKIIFKIKRI